MSHVAEHRIVTIQWIWWRDV